MMQEKMMKLNDNNGFVSLRKFSYEDIPNKITWINNPENNTFLHYDLPLEYEKTCKWFENIRGRNDRSDWVIEYDSVPVGLIGLISIDQRNKKAEYYITMGEAAFKGKGIAKVASFLLLKYAFEHLSLHRVYLYTEVTNEIAQKLFESIGFIKEGLVREDVITAKGHMDRFIYGFLESDWKSTD